MGRKSIITDDLKEKAFKMFEQNKSIAAVSRELGISYGVAEKLKLKFKLKQEAKKVLFGVR